ncbi:MAG: hypothetical protein U0636_11815 [Phycisphaerales bacterium]
MGGTTALESLTIAAGPTTIGSGGVTTTGAVATLTLERSRRWPALAAARST